MVHVNDPTTSMRLDTYFRLSILLHDGKDPSPLGKLSNLVGSHTRSGERLTSSSISIAAGHMKSAKQSEHVSVRMDNSTGKSVEYD